MNIQFGKNFADMVFHWDQLDIRFVFVTVSDDWEVAEVKI
jgi:hypothetical protein